MSKQEQEHMWRLAARYSSVGIEIAIALSMGTFGGRWLDTKFGTGPGFLIFGIIVGLGAGANAIRRVMKQAKQDHIR